MELINHKTGEFPGGPVVKNPPCNAGDSGSIPGQGTKVSLAVDQLSLSATTKTQHGQSKIIRVKRISLKIHKTARFNYTLRFLTHRAQRGIF